MKKLFISICLIASGLLILPHNHYAENLDGEDLRLIAGEVEIISVNSPKRVAIGNPAILDVAGVTKTELTLNPKSAGATTLVVWDNFGEMSYKVRVLTEDMDELKKRVDRLLGPLNLPEVYAKAEEGEGKIALLGWVKTTQDKERVLSALDPVKEKIMDIIQVKEEEAVVEIDVQVLELDKDATNILGMSWPGVLTFTEKGSPGIASTGAKWSNLFKVLSLQRTALNWTIDALVQEGKAKILSRPRLACQSGKEAELLVGGERPILTTEIVSGVSGQASTSVSYKDFGIKLKIRPVVRDDGRIKLALNMEVSEIGEAIVLGTTDNPTAKAWPLSKRNASTELILDNEQTLAIGGLIKRKNEEDIRKTPFLGDVPVLGALFRRKLVKVGNGQGERGDTELFITLTPTIVSGKEQIAAFQPKKEPVKENVPGAGGRFELPPELAGYAHVIQKRILESLTYPSSAKDAGFQGIVRLSLHLSYKGDLMDVLIKDSSGYKIIDDNAVAVVKGISSYPPFPSTIVPKDLWIDIPIEYRLN